MSETLMQIATQFSDNALTMTETAQALASIPENSQMLLRRMFADPRVLEKNERAELMTQLGDCVEKYPKVSELRVLYGMALCVNLEVQDAMEEFGEAVALAPDSYIAHLKMGELWMRLRVMEKAEDHTKRATQLAQNMAQSELARRQAAQIRTMRREGIERGGYASPWNVWSRVRRMFARDQGEALAPVEAR